MTITIEPWADTFYIFGEHNTIYYLQPEITQMSSGEILVSYMAGKEFGDFVDPSTDIEGVYFDPLGGRLDTSGNLTNGYIADYEQNHKVVLTDSGAVMLFEDMDGSYRSLRLQRYNDDMSYNGDVVTIIADDYLGTSYIGGANVSYSSGSKVMITYLIPGGVNDVDLVYRMYDFDTDTLGDEIVMFGGGTEVSDADIAVLDNGNFVIVARDSEADSVIEFRIFTAAGVNVRGVTDVGDSGTNATEDYEPSVTGLKNGGFVVSWTNVDANDTDVHFQVYDNAGTKFGTQKIVGPGGVTDNHLRSQVVALEDGGFMVLYTDGESGSTGIKAEAFTAGGASNSATFTITTNAFVGFNALLLADGRIAVALTYSYGSMAMTYIDPRETVSAVGVTDSQYVVGTRGADDLVGSGLDFKTIDAWYGDDTLGFSSDFKINRTFDGGEGVDTFDFTGLTGNFHLDLDDGFIGRIGRFRVSDVINVENIQAGSGDDVLIGDGGANDLYGNAGRDNLDGQAGVDRLYGGDESDTLNGGGGNDLLRGGKGNDILNGGSGKDKLYGGKGKDVLNGGSGDDKLYGESGYDVFVFAPNGGHDIVQDFINGIDKLDLSAFNFANKADAKSHFAELGAVDDGEIRFDFDGMTIDVRGLDMSDLTNADLII